ncbi:hypothetical protein QJS10_CPB22g00115 [Acorus calamus]|uniref:DUF7392 domain-containing protein n=1 Tax=Acorus calamus TaxID=4465 RepID=A0AAV9C2U6_ACOCL|nr:hypothetical protein QJS10_CPB22g00115 [Acorus calamus]
MTRVDLDYEDRMKQEAVPQMMRIFLLAGADNVIVEVNEDPKVSTLSSISNLAILLDHGFLGAYAGQNKDGRPSSAAKFSLGDAVSVYNMFPKNDNNELLSYACMAILRSFLATMEGVASGLCFNRQDKPMVSCLQLSTCGGRCSTVIRGS